MRNIRRAAKHYALPFNGSDIEIGQGECVVLDEFAVRVDLVSRRFCEDVVGIVCLFHLDLQRGPDIRIRRRFPELFRVRSRQEAKQDKVRRKWDNLPQICRLIEAW